MPDGFKAQPKNRGCAFNTNLYMAEFIHNQAAMLLPQRSKIYHPSTAPFVNSDTFMKQPYYIIHASLGFKDKNQYSYYLSGHAEDQQEYKQKPVSDQKQGKLPRTYSHNSQMNATSSVPFYPNKPKIMPKPVIQMQAQSFKDMNKRRFPTSVSHGMLAGMGHGGYGPPPGMEHHVIMSHNNLYRAQFEQVEGANDWNQMQYHPQPDITSYSNHPTYGGGQWSASQNHMIPSALQPHHSMHINMNPKKMSGIKGSQSTEFKGHFGSKMISETENKFGLGYFDNDSDSDGENNDAIFNNFHNKHSSTKLFHPTNLKNVNENEENKEQ